jgi:NitT/TauT family transport system permease protein
MRERLIQLTSIVVVIVLWALLSAVAGPEILPPPARVASSLGNMLASGDFLEPLSGSLLRTLLGFAGAMLLGLAYGITAARSARFNHAFAATFNALLFAPTLVIVFVGLLVLGYSASWAVVVITSIAVFPNIAVYIRDVMRHVDEDIVGMARSFHVGGWRRIADVYVPYLTPPLLSSTRIGLNSSWKVVLLCEIFGFPGGLGFSIRNSYASFDIATMLAWVALFVLALVLLEQVIRLVETRVVRWA